MHHAFKTWCIVSKSGRYATKNSRLWRLFFFYFSQDLNRLIHQLGSLQKRSFCGAKENPASATTRKASSSWDGEAFFLCFQAFDADGRIPVQTGTDRSFRSADRQRDRPLPAPSSARRQRGQREMQGMTENMRENHGAPSGLAVSLSLNILSNSASTISLIFSEIYLLICIYAQWP